MVCIDDGAAVAAGLGVVLGDVPMVPEVAHDSAAPPRTRRILQNMFISRLSWWPLRRMSWCSFLTSGAMGFVVVADGAH